ncbi:rab-GTPase-TBC domain-containing protein [Cokeromyces recurvatus]|uniref:rab-GTPase-TBC domain-containing protein n=1 Tax=Cokeromyces recurvatus TaxID=90255 RepID=UPI00221FFDAB|nr:rab-GTPase-TBC domain-containing protein [Cokeromyces recurvatus]KAI7897510.1 rab-GTPase-TBC domain-containing protein [Cokeromyces recurvatus]
MALFINAVDLIIPSRIPKLASINFIASSRVSETLAASGHLALSAPSQIIGQFQYLKTLIHPHLCQYIEIHRGKHDRLFVVSEYHDVSLQKTRSIDSHEQLPISLFVLKQWAFEIFSALHYLKEHNIIHASLSPSNILLDKENHIKLFNYGLYYMTSGGRDVDFPIGYPAYLAPECLENLKDKQDVWATGIILIEQYLRNSFWTTSDVGLIFDSLLTLKEWQEEDPTSNVWKHADIETLDINKSILKFLQIEDHKDPEEQAFHQFILNCLKISTTSRFDVRQALSSSFFEKGLVSVDAVKWVEGPLLASNVIELETIDTLNSKSQEDAQDILQDLPMTHIYHLWKLAGGDVELDLVKRGIFLSTPVIKRLPRACIMPEGIEIGDKVMDTTQLYSDAIYVLGFKELYQRLEEAKQKGESNKFEWDMDYFILVDENDANFLLDNDDDYNSEEHDDKELGDECINDLLFSDNFISTSDSVCKVSTPTTPSSSRSISRAVSMTSMGRSRSTSSLSVNSMASLNNQPHVSKLPLLLREQDIDYQRCRLSLFADLLRQYPASRKEIIQHAKIDIPPLLRGKIWAAILGVHGDLEYEYDQINKYIDMGADRQIEVDVPRCHQYNQLLASSTGHEKLRKLLKAWVSANKNLVYWQGLDSLCAPFLTLNFNDEAIAFACLQKFIPKFLNNFFLSDNALVIQEYLAVFRHLLSYHDPELSSHLDAIGFMPDLYAIPWFLTLFTHVFPLDKIYHLWDKLLVGPPALPLFAGIAILKQIRDTLLSYEFNDCIVLFSDNFPKVDIEKCVQSALNMCKVTPPSISSRVHGPSSADNIEVPLKISIEIKKTELAPRLSVKDLLNILSYSLIIDIRSESEFVKGHIPLSINVQAAQLPSYANILKKLNRKYHVVIANEGGPEYAAELVRKGFPRVALLQDGIQAFEQINNETVHLCICRPQKQTTAGYKGKGSEPPFVMWRCKIPFKKK